MVKIFKQDKFLALICLQLICLSGSIFWYIQFPIISVIIWVITTFAYWFKKGDVNYIFKSNFNIWLAWAIWTFLCTFIVHQNPIDNEIYVCNLIPLGCAFLISSVSFNKFRNILFSVSRYLFGTSLFIHLLHSFGILGANYVSYRNGAYYAMTLFLFHTEWGTISTPFGELYRFSSLFWEAGQCQIVLFFILLLFTDDLKENLFNLRYIFKKYGVLILAFLLTGSTTGYLVFLIYICSLILYSRASQKYRFLYPIFIILALSISFLIYNSPVVQEKLAQSSEKSENTSYAIRMMDNVACLQAALDNKTFGLGYNTQSLYKVLTKNGSITSSNGFFRAAAAFGIYFVLGICILLWKRIRLLKLGIPSIILVACLIFSQSNEYFIAFPYFFLYLFKFKKYD